jgi:putative transposase
MTFARGLLIKADGWYVAISLEDSSVPTPKPIDEIKTAVGIDLGLKSFLVTSTL